jgi:hypothetical protein
MHNSTIRAHWVAGIRKASGKKNRASPRHSASFARLSVGFSQHLFTDQVVNLYFQYTSSQSSSRRETLRICNVFILSRATADQTNRSARHKNGALAAEQYGDDGLNFVSV